MIGAGFLSEWLLESDPALRWQVGRDLLGAALRLGCDPAAASRRRATVHGSSRFRILTVTGTAAPSSPATRMVGRRAVSAPRG
ncbi:hypothetical protein [Sinomonas sp. G460-2]|uniref:hypothetical protein n=1 Tax=Sinomonas sp. G460-2 TaxID=3393464 RepID=UPI0039EFE686